MGDGVQEKLALIKRNLQEVTDEKVLDEIVASRPLVVYWGTAITAAPHIAYFIPLIKIKDLLEAGCVVKILFADIHGFLDSMKAPIEQIKQRLVYYKLLVSAMLRRLGLDPASVEFVEGSSYQTSAKYTFDLHRISSYTTVSSAIKAGTQVVKQSENPLLSSLIYPNMQALDEEYLGVDAQLGGVDQRKIFMHANKYLPKLGYRRRVHLMNPMMAGLGRGSGKMSASEKSTKIDLRDTYKQLKDKISRSFCEPKNIETGILSIFRHIIFPVGFYKVEVDGKVYAGYEELESAFADGTVFPTELKEACVKYLEDLVAPVREEVKAQEGQFGGAFF